MSVTSKRRDRLSAVATPSTTFTHDASGNITSSSTTVAKTYVATDLVIGDQHSFPIGPKGRIGTKRWLRHLRPTGGSVDIVHRVVTPVLANVDVKSFVVGSGGPYQTYSGILYCGTFPSGSFSTTVPGELSDITLSGQGAVAWARYKPTAQRGGLGQALGELHDLPSIPKLWKLKRQLAQVKHIRDLHRLGKISAGDYLNYQFGWVPLVKDVLDLIKNIKNLNRNIAQLERDNGRPVRRGGLVSKTSSTTEVTTALTASQMAGGCIGAASSIKASMFKESCTKTVSTTTSTDYKFSARFRYFIDFAKAHRGDMPESIQLTRILLGAEVDAYVLYELIPWTWLFEWFTNGIGASINNLVNDRSDNLVADYAYINGKQTINVKSRISCPLVDFGKGPIEDFSIGIDVESSYFKRRSASPYGFGLSWDGLSLKQLAILGALGITKGT